MKQWKVERSANISNKIASIEMFLFELAEDRTGNLNSLKYQTTNLSGKVYKLFTKIEDKY